MYKLRIYKKNLEYSYAFGVLAVTELFKHAPQLIDQLVFSSNKAQDPMLKDILQQAKMKKIPAEAHDHKIRMLAPKGNTFVIAVFKKFYQQLQPDRPHVVLVSPTNTGNLGMIVRAMLAFGIADLAIVKPAVDAFDPKVVASSVGAIFQIRITYYDSLEQYIAQTTANNKKRKIFTFTLDKARDLREVKFSEFNVDNTFSLVFGNEANGLSEEDANRGERLNIPQSNKIDSLNLAVAVGIVLWEVTR